MLIPFLAAAAVATTVAHLGAMSVQISILTLALKALSVVLLITVALAAIAMFLRGRPRRLP